MKRYLLTSTLLLGFVIAARADTSWPNAALSSTQMNDVNRIMATIENRADKFETEFRKALRSSTVPISEREKYRRWVDQVEDELDNMAEDYHENDVREAQKHLAQAMDAARNLNHFMLNTKWSPEAESLWKSIRDDLNTLAGYHKAPPEILIISTR